MLELKQIDDNTYSINGRTFKHTGEDVRSPMEQNVAEVRYTVEYCKANKIGIRISSQAEWNIVSKSFGKEWSDNTWNLSSDSPILYWHNFQDAIVIDYSKDEVCGTDIIPAATFIAHNTQQQDKQAYPWQKGFEVLQCKNHLDAIIDKNDDGTFGESKATISQIIENSFTHIHSIRRLSDNAVFTVGDKVQTANDGALEIKGVEICGNSIVFKFAIGSLNATEGQPYKLPTLAEVFKSVQPKCFLNDLNQVDEFLDEIQNSGKIEHQHCVSTESQCEQIQAYIALVNIATMLNGEAGWMPNNGEHAFALVFDKSIPNIMVAEVTNFVMPPLAVYFKQREHAEQAISILKEAGLLDALKG